MESQFEMYFANFVENCYTDIKCDSRQIRSDLLLLHSSFVSSCSPSSNLLSVKSQKVSLILILGVEHIYQKKSFFYVKAFTKQLLCYWKIITYPNTAVLSQL